jgi:hypothetical protein
MTRLMQDSQGPRAVKAKIALNPMVTPGPIIDGLVAEVLMRRTKLVPVADSEGTILRIKINDVWYGAAIVGTTIWNMRVTRIYLQIVTMTENTLMFTIVDIDHSGTMRPMQWHTANLDLEFDDQDNEISLTDKIDHLLLEAQRKEDEAKKAEADKTA